MTSSNAAPRAALYRTLWRWHFYAGLLVLPFVAMLSITGSIYLFKPQIDRWEESGWRNLSTANAVTPNVQLASALRALPGARFNYYRLPEMTGDAAIVRVALPRDAGMRDVVVSPGGTVMAIVDPETRITAFISRFHGSLLLGQAGRYVVEAAASWAIFLIISGLYLWWPRGRGLAGVVWPRLNRRNHLLWRDLHAVTGFWVAGLALILLTTGLPWTDVWATGFRMVRAEMGWTTAPPDWRGGMGPPADNGHRAMIGFAKPSAGRMTLSDIAGRARFEAMPAPAIISPPGAPARFGPDNGTYWKLTSQTQNRPEIKTILYDVENGAVIDRRGFADKHMIDRIINYGIAWHEGQLLGWLNQAIGVMTALMLIALAASGAAMWWRKRPTGTLGAPPIPGARQMRMITVGLTALAVILPMLGASLVVFWVLDQAIQRAWPPLGARLGRM